MGEKFKAIPTRASTVHVDIMDAVVREAKESKESVESQRLVPSTSYGVMEQSWCCTCRAIQPMVVSSAQTLKDRVERDTMHNGRWHKEEPKGGYWCAVCGNRPHTAPRQPGRQQCYWEEKE